MLPASPHAHLAVQACTRGMAATAAGTNYITSGFMTSTNLFFLKNTSSPYHQLCDTDYAASAGQLSVVVVASRVSAEISTAPMVGR